MRVKRHQGLTTILDEAEFTRKYIYNTVWTGRRGGRDEIAASCRSIYQRFSDGIYAEWQQMKLRNLKETALRGSRVPRSFMHPFTISMVLSIFIHVACSINSENYEICQTARCRKIANQLAKDMDTSVNPCDDFYEYMCGGFIRNNPIPENQLDISQIKMMEDRIISRLGAMLSNPAKDNDTRSLKYAKDIYRMCQDTVTLENLGIAPLVNMVEAMGGWPIARSIGNGNLSWQETYMKINRIFVSNAVIDITVNPDSKNADANILTLFDPSFSLARETFMKPEENKEKLAAYGDYIEEVARAFVDAQGSKVSDDAVRQDVQDMIAFESQLVNISLSSVDARNVDIRYNLMTIDELQQKYDDENPLTDVSKIDWLAIVRNLLSLINVDINGSEKLVVAAKQYFLRLPRILDDTSQRTVVNYIQWRFIRSIMSYTDRKTAEISLRFNSRIHGVQEEEERWKKCIRIQNLHTAMSYEYVRTYFPAYAKEETLRVVEDIREVVENEISRAEWMDDETKRVSVDKLRAIKSNIGYPEWYNATAIDIYYDGVNVTSNYFESVINSFIYEGMRTLRNLRKPVDKKDLLLESFEVNGYYSDTTNAMFFSAGILQEPAFDPLRPAAMNYGAIGMIIGHEISHAFDDAGRKFDKHGNSVQWWTNRTIGKYERVEKCFIDQYSEYIIPELSLEINRTVHVNGRLTVGENIGDSGGISAAYKAYQRRLNESQGKEMKLPGFQEYTENQLFFMSFANLFCEKKRASVMEDGLDDTHPPARIRIRGSLSNLHEFGEAFNCPVGSPMNPQKKCKLW